MDPGATMGSATLIGRRTELDAIGHVVEAARTGRSGVLLVRGVAGVGKTAMLDEIAGGASDFRLLRAEGVEAETELAFAGLHQLLLPLTPLLDGLRPAQRRALEAAFGLTPNGSGDRFLAATGALALLAEAAEERPLLCMVDDLQWIDRPSADALVFVARRLHAEPVAVLLAMRDTAPVPAGLERFPRLELGGLERSVARELLDGSARLPPAERDRVLDAAEGIPLALLELSNGAHGADMSSVERAFAERVAALDHGSRRAVLLAAADDDPHGGTALKALPDAGLTVADLAAAETAGLVWFAGEQLVFRHPLVRSAAYALAPFEERRRAHLALAEVLSRPADADRRAWHLAATVTAPDAAVADELARSAERARTRGGHASAAAALERSARLTSAEPLRARRLVAAAEAARLAGDVDRAVALAGAGIDSGADAETAAEAAAIRGAIHAHRGDPEDAETDLRNAARALAASQPERARRVALLAGETAAIGGRHRSAEEIARWAASLPAGDTDADRAVVAFAEGVAHTFGGRAAEAHDRFLVGLGLAERSGDPQVLIWAGVGAVYAGDLVAGRRAFARAVATARERGAVGLVAFGLQFVAKAEAIEGRFALSRTDAADGLSLAEQSGEEGAAAHCRALLAWHAAIRGDEDECRARAGEALDWASATSVVVAAETAHQALALLDLGLGRHEAAFDRLATVVGDPRAHPARRFLAAGDLIEAAARCGRTDAARTAVDELAVWGRATGSTWAAAILAGGAVQLAPDLEGAEAGFARALEAHAEIDLPFERARLDLRLGERLRRARRRMDARRHLRAALHGFAHLGAGPWERRAAAELRATGETARRRDPSTLDGLTPQELQIARLVAEGATNREIAGRLFLSTRTVDYHLRKVFQKLSVTKRTQLADLDW
jgi:DNA-binding CsgD family transcriptional regulator